MYEERERPVASSRRRHERVWFRYKAELVLSGGHAVSGTTQDLSLKGLFLITAGQPAGVAVGDTGTLRFSVLNLRKEFSCRVVHLQSNGMGLEVQDSDESLETVLTDLQAGDVASPVPPGSSDSRVT
ncbi:MAG: PilZ domain-containing protein [Magnetococcales bacterium]|nr:PilZ domain-containing protein [Magnetococcales bacterium]